MRERLLIFGKSFGRKMKRENLILPYALSYAQPTGVLDTPRKTREASYELSKTVSEDFAGFDRARKQSLVDAKFVVLD